MQNVFTLFLVQPRDQHVFEKSVTIDLGSQTWLPHVQFLPDSNMVQTLLN